jgi:predicted XRE-type DNA-binding protein
MILKEHIINKILFIREKKVMLDRDLAELYGVSTKRLNEQVRRNLSRFPDDFMFQLTDEEKKEVVAFCDHLNDLIYSPYLPNAFTEHGAVMLASVLNSERAIQVNIQIVRIFNDLRKVISKQSDIEEIKNQLSKHENKILSILEYLRNHEKVKQREEDFQKRKRIGYKRTEE